EEELGVGAAECEAVGNARNADLGRVRSELDALEGARERLEAAQGGALAAVLVAVCTRLELLAFRVATDRADAAVVRARRARLTGLADAVAAAFAFSAVVGAGET